MGFSAHCPTFVALDKLSTIKESSDISDDDVRGMALGLARIQITYNLDPYDIAKGILAGKETKAKLAPEDLLFVATDRLNNSNVIFVNDGPNYAIALQWLEAAKK